MRGDPQLIQEGSYGCAFNPPLPCKKTKGKSKSVGKIIRKKDAKIELKMASILQGIPGWQRYYILQEEDTCTSTNFKELRPTYESNCGVLKRTTNSSLLQLVSPYGGTSFHSFSITNSFDFMGSFRHVLEGIALLRNQGICHYDLHEGNLVIDGRGTLRILDFGAAFVGDSVTEDSLWRHIYSFQPDYPPQPPEVAVQNGLYQGLSYSFSIEQTIAQKRIFKLKERLLGVRAADDWRALQRFWTEDPVWKGDSWVPFFRTYWTTWDPWAIGVIFLKVLERCFLLPSFITNVWYVHGNTVRTVLKGMLEVDPRKRMSPSDALQLLKKSEESSSVL
jgi:serine/threonine protein kinase